MLWNAKNGTVRIGDSSMNYVSFGRGEKTLILLPGLSDGLTTVKGKALLLAKPYIMFFEKYTVYMFSRKNDMPGNYSIRDMAADQAEAMNALGIGKACLMGVSQGGMIAQYLAIDHPELIDKLILAVSSPCANDTIRECVGKWIELARLKDHKALMIDTAEKSYSSGYLEKYRKVYPLLGQLGKPSDYDRFLVNANAVLGFDASGELIKISCPALIIGGGQDRIVGTRAAYDLKEMISDSQLYVYPDYGHAAYEEAKDFNQRVFRFLESS